MSLDRKFRACFISFILLISSFAAIAIIPQQTKADEGKTTLYFHDISAEEAFDQDILDLLAWIGDFDFGAMEELLDELLVLYNIDPDDLTPEQEARMREIEEIFEEMEPGSGLGRLDIGNVIDSNPPTKINDSEYPPTLRRFVELFFDGDFLTFIKDIISGGEIDENMFSQFEELIMDMVLSFASFRGYYVYDGEDSISLNGELMFNLYFSSPLSYIIDSDTANITFVVYEDVYDPDFGQYVLEPKTTKSASVLIKRQLLSPLKNPTLYEIPTIVDTELDPGDIIMADIDIVPGERRLFDYFDEIDFSELNLNETFEALAELVNSTEMEELDPLVDMLLNLSEGGIEDFSTEDITTIFENLTSSFVYDSISHPSSIILPAPIGSADEENAKTYYLHSGSIMNENTPDGSTSQADLESVVEWDGPVFERSKVIKDAAASLYIDHQDLFRILNILRGPIEVTASLLLEGQEISSSTEVFGRTTILNMFTRPSQVTTFSFSDIGQEIEYGDSLSLEVSAEGTTFGILNFRKNVRLLYGSSDFPSSLILKFGETDNIVISGDESNKIVALGESVEYNLTVTSESSEDITMAVYDLSSNERKDWGITIVPESFSINAGGQETVIVTVTSKDDDLDAYDRGDQLKVTFAAEGKTGKGLFGAEVEISRNAIEYDIDVTVKPSKQEIRHGENNTYVFTITNNNTGLWPDSYTVKVASKHDWASHSIDKSDLKDILPGEKIQVEVKVSVPQYTNITSDKLTFEIQGEETSTIINVTTSVTGPNILEGLYHFFESLGEDIGLDEALGSSANAAILLASIVFIIIFFFVIILVYLLTIKYVDAICLEGIKDISPDEEAKFEITIKNPYKYGLSYEVSAVKDPSNKGWKVSLDTESIALESKQSKTVTLTVKPTDFVKPDDWIEVGVVAKVVEKQKTAELSTVTIIKDAKPELRISGMIHWPTSFKKGDKVITSFKLRNEGNAAASNVRVVLYVNSKEKNKVEDITIPRGAYADIEIPWVAVKGKNEVNIEVN